MASKSVTDFLNHHFRHFNAATLVEAAAAYNHHLERGGKMMIAMAGAMSTAEIGLSLAEMIRQNKVHAISCTGANLEEDVFNLVAHNHYERVRRYRELTPHDEEALLKRRFNRVTDTCIPEKEAMKYIEAFMLDEWMIADRRGVRYLPHRFFFNILRDPKLQATFQIDPKDSWLFAAMEKDLPLFVPGWEDCSLGNIYAAHCMAQEIKNVHTVKTGVEYMIELANWYTDTSAKHSMGFFQIGGGIAGDFPICVVPMLRQEVKRKDVPVWGYYCQISDSTTSYGSYSGAVPNEKITWDKLDINSATFIIESDASIVTPLVFAYVLDW
jgi:deoxyhypusine synthase